MPTLAFDICHAREPGVEKSLDTAGKSARATSTARVLTRIDA